MGKALSVVAPYGRWGCSAPSTDPHLRHLMSRACSDLSLFMGTRLSTMRLETIGGCAVGIKEMRTKAWASLVFVQARLQLHLLLMAIIVLALFLRGWDKLRENRSFPRIPKHPFT